MKRQCLIHSKRFVGKRAHEYANTNNDYKNIFSETSKKEIVHRMERLKYIRFSNFKREASVLVCLCLVKNEPSLLYTVRARGLTAHSGQVSFPGGLCDRTDRDVIHTALREAEEEIGIPQHNVDVWGLLPNIADRNQTTKISPVVGNIGVIRLDQLKRNNSEVEKIFTVPIKRLCDRKINRYTRFKTEKGGSILLPAFPIEPRIWGITAVATQLLLIAMFPNLSLTSN